MTNAAEQPTEDSEYPNDNWPGNSDKPKSADVERLTPVIGRVEVNVEW